MWRELFGLGSIPRLGQDLVDSGAAAVMARAMALGDTLVLPNLLSFTLPDEELRLFESARLREGLSRALKQDVTHRAQEYVKQLGKYHGRVITILGGDDLRFTMVAGPQRGVEATFEGKSAEVGPPAPQPPVPGRRPATPAAGRPTIVDLPTSGVVPGVTVADDAAQLVLRSDGSVLDARPVPAAGEMTVGRNPEHPLCVPQVKDRVSRLALNVTRLSPTEVSVEVHNLNGVWITRLPGGGQRLGREHIAQKGRTTVRQGERIDLDKAGTVSVTLETG